MASSRHIDEVSTTGQNPTSIHQRGDNPGRHLLIESWRGGLARSPPLTHSALTGARSERVVYHSNSVNQSTLPS